MQEVANILPLFVVLALIAHGAGLAIAESKYKSSTKSWSEFDTGKH